MNYRFQVRSEDYQQDIKYLNNNGDYQQSSQPIQYVEYPQQVETAVPKSLSQTSTYETPQQQLYYQPEVSVGNHYQSIQQKTAAQKFAKNSNKGNGNILQQISSFSSVISSQKNSQTFSPYFLTFRFLFMGKWFFRHSVRQYSHGPTVVVLSSYRRSSKFESQGSRTPRSSSPYESS